MKIFKKGDKYAVMVGYKTVWSSYCADDEIAYDKDVIEWYLDACADCKIPSIATYGTPENEAAYEWFSEHGYPDVYLAGLTYDMIVWVSMDAIWRIKETTNDYEEIEIFDKSEWHYVESDGFCY